MVKVTLGERFYAAQPIVSTKSIKNVKKNTYFLYMTSQT